MKTRILSLSALIFIAISVMSYTTNTTGQAGDVTGSPLSNNTTCISCHITGATRPLTIMFATLATGGAQVTSFIPGQQYTINISSVQSTFLYPKFGFQICVLTSDNNNAGTFTAATTGAALTSANGISYVEHGSPLTITGSTARAQFNWTAPNTNRAVTFYAVILQSNDNGGVNGDITSQPGTLTLESAVNIGGIHNISDKLKIYPNPATDYISISLPDISEPTADLNVFDLLGRKIYTAELDLTKGKIAIVPVSDLPQGLYHLSIKAGDYIGDRTFAISK